jgi:transcriptional regulator with XRE-family HTH domain
MKGRAGATPPLRVPASLSEHIREAITRSGLSVYYVAKKTGVDQSTLNKFLNGTRRNIRLDVADRLFAFFFHPPRKRARPFR